MKPLELGQLFALPLQSAIRAQSLALQESISFIEQFGLDEGKVKTFRFKAERVVEERTVDPKTGIPQTQFNIHPFEVSIPLLAMMTPPSIQLQEMNVEFGVEVVEPRAEVIRSSAIPLGVIGSSLASSLSIFTSLGQPNSATMRVSMKIVRATPEGMARLGDILTDLSSAKGITVRTPPLVEKIPGVSPEAAKALKAKGILTVRDFVSATETGEAIKALARILRVSEKIVVGWREKSEFLIEEEE